MIQALKPSGDDPSNWDHTGKAARRLELARVFLKLGLIGFGGPAAHIAMMEAEVVRRRGWLTHEEFLDLLGATNLIPGPNSTEMAIHIGRQRAGLIGLVVAGGCFIIPAMLLTLAASWSYVRFGKLPASAGILYGIKPVIIAIVLQALWNLGRRALKSKLLIGAAVLAVALNLFGIHELAVLAAIGAIVAVVQWTKRTGGTGLAFVMPAMKLSFASGPAALSMGSVAAFGLWPLFLFFLKVGSVLYGSGYVLLAFLRGDLVERFHWLTEAQLLDAVAIGQITPGPVSSTATFIGYLLGGTPGAVLATLGIFLPAFVFVGLSAPFIPQIRQSALAGAFLDGVNVASLALMAVVTWQISAAALIDWPTVAVAIGAAILLLVFRVNSVWLIGGGAAIGLAMVWLR